MTYQCETCNYKTDKHFNFLKHQNRKTPCYLDYCVDDSVKKDPRECNNCGKLFINDRNLNRHLSVCKGALYKCDVCKKTFGTKYGLYQHRSNTDCHIKIQRPQSNNDHLKVNYFGSENINYIIDNTRKCIEKGVYGLVDLVGDIFMNPQHPENHTISRFREKGKDLFVKTEENGWEFRHYDDVKEYIVDALSKYLKLYYEQIKETKDRHQIRNIIAILITIGASIDKKMCDELNIDECDVENEELVNQKFDTGTLLRIFQRSQVMYRKNGEKIMYRQ